MRCRKIAYNTKIDATFPIIKIFYPIDYQWFIIARIVLELRQQVLAGFSILCLLFAGLGILHQPLKCDYEDKPVSYSASA